MSEKTDLILQKLEAFDELKQIATALRDRQEETDVKLDALSMDVHKLHGELSSVKSTVTDIKQNMATKDDLIYFDKKTAEHDRELFKIKNRSETII